MLDILQLTRDAPDILIPDGQVVIHAGDRNGALYVLVEGVLEVSRRGHTVVRISEPGAIVGELGLLLDIPASADVFAFGPCTVRRMEDAGRTFAANPEFARHLATLLAHRLWQISTYLTDLQVQYADRTDTLGLVPTVLQELLGSRRTQVEPGSEREPDSPY